LMINWMKRKKRKKVGTTHFNFIKIDDRRHKNHI